VMIIILVLAELITNLVYILCVGMTCYSLCSYSVLLFWKCKFTFILLLCAKVM
jgi:membrane protein implicated in regulation of membrane protease activity